MKLNAVNVQKILKQKKGSLKVSIYLPTNPHSNAQSIEQDRTRFKNALQIVRNHHAYDERELGKTLDKVYAELYENMAFWNYQDFGLALLLDANGYEFFHLPYEVTEEEYVSDHYIISPLLVMASADTSYYLLDVNFTKPRLFSGARGTLEEVTVPSMPDSFEKNAGRDWYKNHTLGNEDGALSADENNYLKEIAEEVFKLIKDDSRPLLLAGTTNRTGNMRKVLKYKNVLQATLNGNQEEATTQELYESATPIVRQELRSNIDTAVAKLENAKPEFVVMGRAEIEEAASAGRVETLFLPTYKLTNDSIRKNQSEKLIVELPEDIEDIETMVSAVLKQSGEIIATEIGAYKTLTQAKAICRF
jgi:hypothetical protein